jgi:hypothetical protein
VGLMLAPEIGTLYVHSIGSQRRQTNPAGLAQARAGPNVAATIGASERLARGRGVQILSAIAHACATTGIKRTVFVSSSHALAPRGRKLRRPTKVKPHQAQVGTAEPRSERHATRLRRRHHVRRPPKANVNPGNPAPAIGPGTAGGVPIWIMASVPPDVQLREQPPLCTSYSGDSDKPLGSRPSQPTKPPV